MSGYAGKDAVKAAQDAMINLVGKVGEGEEKFYEDLSRVGLDAAIPHIVSHVQVDGQPLSDYIAKQKAHVLGAQAEAVRGVAMGFEHDGPNYMEQEDVDYVVKVISGVADRIAMLAMEAGVEAT